MRSIHRATLVKALVQITEAARSGPWRVSDDCYLTHVSNDEVALSWDLKHRAYGASWTCGRIAAEDVAHLADAS